MAFIRTKKIKGAEYAYIVENKWKKRGKKVKQKTKKYLGRVYRFDKKDIGFFEFHSVSDELKYIKDKTREDIIIDLVKWELVKHGFKQDKGVLVNGDCIFRLNDKKIMNSKGNKIALGFNQGYLSSYAITNLLHFQAEVEEEGYDLAKLFVEAGIDIPKQVFVGVFSKYNIQPSDEY